MKKFLAILAVLACLTLVSACADAPVVRASAFAGPTGMGMAYLMQANDEGNSGNKYEFTLASAPDQIVPLLAKGELDIACVPANLASVLYNNLKGGVRVLAVNTLGVLYVVSHGDGVSSVEDLRGRTVYASGKGSTPEYAFEYVLDAYGLSDADVNVEWKSEHAEALAAFIQNADSLALLPQPFVTVAQGKAADMKIAIDLNTAWEEANNGSTLITGCVVARTAFVEENPQLVNLFLLEYDASVRKTNLDYAAAAQVIGKYGIVDAAVAEKALPYCHIVCITGEEMRDMLSGYLSVLLAADPASVGGALPADDLYYVAH